MTARSAAPGHASDMPPEDRQEVVSAMKNCETSYDVFRVLKRIAQHFGFDYFSVIDIPSQPEEKFRRMQVVSNWPPEVVQAYDAKGLLKNSPIIAKLRSSTMPVVWELESLNATRARDERDYAIDMFSEFGFFSGVYFPVHDSTTRRGAVSFAGDREKVSIEEQVTLSFYSSLVYDVLSGMRPESNDFREVLSDREKECVHWTAAGKTSAEIAIILELSEHTVNHYLSTACQKLNAQNRAHVVSICLRMGLIDF